MEKKGLTQANTLRSNNTTSTGYGIVYADEIIGGRSVKTRKDLDNLPDWVLGEDNKLEKGTTYYVENEECFYIYTGDGWQKSFKSIGLPVNAWYAYTTSAGASGELKANVLDIANFIKSDDLYMDVVDSLPHPFSTIVVFNQDAEDNSAPVAYITLFASYDSRPSGGTTIVASAKVFGAITNNTFPKTPNFNNINYYEGSCKTDTSTKITNWELTGGNSIISKVWELNDFSIKGNTIKTSEIDFTTDTLQKFNNSISSSDHVIRTQYSVVDTTHDNIVGQMLLIGDSLGHMVTEILTTSATLNNGVIDWNAHSDTVVNTYIRRNHVKEGGNSSIAVGSWSTWTYYSGEGQYNDFKILVAKELNKKVNTSDVVQQTGDSTTSVMSQKAVSDKLSDLYINKLSKDNDSDSSVSDGSEEFVVTDSNNNIALKIDKDGLKAKLLHICDSEGNIIRTITKELLDKIETIGSLMNNSDYGNTCLLQERKGTYYEILKYSVSGNLKASVDTNIVKFNRSIRVECDGVESTDDTTAVSRGIFTMDFTENPIKVDETLSFWYFIPTKYWRPSQITGSAEKKSVDVIRICAYTGDEKIFEDNYAFSQYAYNVGWNLYKFLSDSFVGKSITKITFNFVSFNNNPNFQVWIGQFVADQRITPILNFNMDNDMRGISYTSGFANWLLENEFPVDLRINHLQETSNEDPGYTIVRKLYKKGLANAMPYSGSARNLNLKEAVEYLLNDKENGRLTSLYSSNSERDVVAVGNSTNHIDDTLLVAERLAGYKIMRSTNAYWYTSYMDKESCIMQTFGIGSIPTEEPEDVDSLITKEIEAAKDIIDKAIKYGLAINFLTHQVCSKNQKGESGYNSLGSYYEAVTEILSYAKEKERQGKIRIMSMYNISKELQL